MKVEVALLLYNRPEHGLSVLDSLVRNEVSHVRAFIDGASDAETAARQEQMLEAIGQRSAIRVDVHRHPSRLGLARSVRFALQNTLETADAVILLEDDCVVRPGGIEYFRQGLTALRHNRRIRSICGYLYPVPFIRGDGEPLLLRRFCTWGWATWRDRWQDYDPDLRRVLGRLEARGIRPDDLGRDLAELCSLPEYLDGERDIWSLPWTLEHYASNTMAVYPSDSMIDNIGFDGSGQNCAPSVDFRAPSNDLKRPWKWSQLAHVVENEDFLRGFLDRHGLKSFPPRAPR
jgi:hypothetical protein